MKRLVFLLAVCLLVVGAVAPTLAADPPVIRIAPVWRPGLTLDSIDTAPLNTFNVGDEFNYVDVEIYVTTSVQFWAAQLNCTVAPAALTSYENYDISGIGTLDPGDNVAPVRWGAGWGFLDADFTQVTEPMSATGMRRFTAARFGGPMGSNGYNTTFLLATLRYRAKDLAANATSPFTCTSSFLNKDGKAVLAAQYVAPPTLSVITGYSITAQANYQGRASSAGIAMMCDGPDVGDTPDFTVTSANGSFTYNALRQKGTFFCSFFGNVSNPAAGYQPDLFLLNSTYFTLNASSYQIMPITLQAGNLIQNDAINTDGDPLSPDEVINGADLGQITAPANWEKTSAAGDVNGDKKTDKADLAMAAGNYNYFEWVPARHLIYSLPRDWQTYRNSRIWLGGEYAGAVTQLVSGTNKDFWATLSPDGKTLAFVRGVGPVGCTYCTTALFTAPVSGTGVVGAVKRLTPNNWQYNAYAPSWSPDGTRIAFSCSWWNDDPLYGGYGFDDGNICTVDANGQNLRTVTNGARIYPPTWYINAAKETFLVFGGSDYNQTCPYTICFTDIQGAVQTFDSDIDTSGNQIADMPIICNQTGCDKIFYRYDDGVSSRVIRWATIDTTITDIPAYASYETSTGPLYHTEVKYDDDGIGPGTTFSVPSTDVDYYNLAQNNFDLIYYETFMSWAFQNAFIDTASLGGGLLTWRAPQSHAVFDQVANPDFFGCGCDPDQYYALRNTVEIAP
jgi:hypothetical protein